MFHTHFSLTAPGFVISPKESQAEFLVRTVLMRGPVLSLFLMGGAGVVQLFLIRGPVVCGAAALPRLQKAPATAVVPNVGLAPSLNFLVCLATIEHRLCWLLDCGV